jgi:heme-degrading monooxygenase HmoA
VITRLWRGWAPAGRAHDYEQHYRTEVLAVLRTVAGFQGARLLRRANGDETEFVSLTFFDDLDAVRAFAGPDFDTAIVAEDARVMLIRFDDHVGHYETVFETA